MYIYFVNNNNKKRNQCNTWKHKWQSRKQQKHCIAPSDQRDRGDKAHGAVVELQLVKAPSTDL